MTKCNCKDINISQADIKLRDLHNIEITLTREPDTPLISELRKQIADLQELGLKFEDIDKRLAEAIQELDIATKAYVAELLENYVAQGDLDALKSDIKEWANSRFLRKIYISQEAYDALDEKEENVLYCIQ